MFYYFQHIFGVMELSYFIYSIILLWVHCEYI